MSLRATLYSEIDGFLQRTGMTPTAFGKDAVGDPNFVFGVRSGRQPRADTIDKVRRFIAATEASKFEVTTGAMK